jgi:plastocyanin
MEERKTQAQLRRFAGVLGAVVALAATAGPASADVTVYAYDNYFSDSTAEITPGETVTWRNAGSNPHDVVFQDGPTGPPEGASPAAWEWPRTFTSPGTYSYWCSIHRSRGMTGSVTVSAVTLPPAPPPPPGPPPPGGSPPGGDPSPAPPSGGKLGTTVTLKVSDLTPARGSLVRFSGFVKPARDGRLLRLQRRGRGGSYRAVKRLKLKDAGSSRSRFSGRLRIFGDAVFRARLPGDSEHEAGTSRARRLKVH